MNCLNCDGSLVFRQTHEYPLDDNGVFHVDDEFTIEDYGVFCSTCGARHTYDTLMTNEDGGTVALTGGDPDPVSTLAISHRNGFIEEMDSLAAVGVIVIDENKREVGLFMMHPTDNSPSLARANALRGGVKKGQWKASFRSQDHDD